MFAVRISTYNLKNLFLCGEGPPKPQSEVRPLLRMFTQVDADLCMLQEVGSLASLQALNAGLVQPYPFAALLPGNSDRSIHLAVLSRMPVRLSSHREKVLLDVAGNALLEYATEPAAIAKQLTPLRFSRDLLRVDVAGLEAPLSLFGVHLKSRTNRPWRALAADVIRTAECAMLCRLIEQFQQAHPHTLVGLCGDFNDRLSSDALAPLAGLEMSDPLGQVLQQSGHNPSTYWPKRRMRIDHILLSREAAQRVVEGSPEIHANRMAQTASDHYPVSLVLNVAPSREDFSHNDRK